MSWYLFLLSCLRFHRHHAENATPAIPEPEWARLSGADRFYAELNGVVHLDNQENLAWMSVL
jgi:hypothetical protein